MAYTNTEKIYKIRRTLTSVEILALLVTPILLIPTPGVGKAIEVISATGRLNYNSIAYTANLTLTIRAVGGASNQSSISNILNGVVTKISRGGITATSGAAQTAENVGLEVTTTSTAPLTGNSTVDLYISYRIITL